MGLQKYFKKRDFKKTPEPQKKQFSHEAELRFVIQRHQASHLHYDLRLEMEGVLKSWAVPKGPSLNPKDKRLAMMVEDHPFDYRTFEGIIPEGNYGAGIVEIWDEGIYHAIDIKDKKESEENLLKALKAGNLKFVLHGKKLKGEFALVKMKNNQKNAWLLIKHNDAYAVKTAYNSEDDVPVFSKINQKLKKSRPEKRKKQRAIPLAEVEKKLASLSEHTMPHEIKPMLAKLIDQPFNDPEWIFEIKWDGYRAIAEVENGLVKLYSRSGKSFNQIYTPVVEELGQLRHIVILDGEIAVLDKKGHSKFQLLQKYGEQGGNLCYYVFDLIYLDEHDLRKFPLIERKEILKEMIHEGFSNIKYSDHIHGGGIALFKEAKKNDIEGIIAKKADSPYRMGKRSDEWVKIKIAMRQETVIGGFTKPRGGRKYLGALVLGVYKNGKLKYVGHSGGGFTGQLLKETSERLVPLIQETSPFEDKVLTNSPVTWVQPKLVCEIAFSEWTADLHMRHPIFVGFREDINPKTVVREIPEKIKKLPKQNQDSIKSKTKKSENKKRTQKEKAKVANQQLTLSNLDKIYWPDEKYTKADLIHYYTEVADYLLPYLKNRPESLHRHPNGIKAKGFYHKDMADTLPDWVKTIEIYSASNDKTVNYLVCQDKATLTYMNNLGCIEINPWNSRINSLEKPDYIVIDLDPGINTFDEVIETAWAVKEVLDIAGAESYCKTSGASGMHIYIPLGARYDYEQAREFAHIIAQVTHEKLPALTSIERSPKTRLKKIYLDYLQNSKGQTLAAVYSVRPKPGATVSTPLKWKEVKKGLHPSEFTIKTVPKRLKKTGDIFSGIWGKELI